MEEKTTNQVEEKVVVEVEISIEQKELLRKILEVYRSLKCGNLNELDFMFWGKITDYNIVQYKDTRQKLQNILFPKGTSLFKEYLEITELLEIMEEPTHPV